MSPDPGSVGGRAADGRAAERHKGDGRVRAWRERFVARGARPVVATRLAGRLGRVVGGLGASDASGSGAPAAVGAFVPGRIEVLGKHTDYAGGRSLLAAIERGPVFAARRTPSPRVRVVDLGRRLHTEVDLRSFTASPAARWTTYPVTVLRRLSANFPGAMGGADITFENDLPSAAGMSSSSTLVTGLALVLAALFDLASHPAYASLRSPEDLAGYLGCIENGQSFGSLTGESGVGTFGGSEDHTAMLCSVPGALVRYAFRPVRREGVTPLFADSLFVVATSGVSASKIGDAREAYNRLSRLADELERRLNDDGRRAARPALSLAARFSADPDGIGALRRSLSSSGERALLARLDHLALESGTLIPDAWQALVDGDRARFGRAVAKSQEAAETLLGNQVDETVALVRSARDLGALAASSFGAGFGGSVWALVEAADAERFARTWLSRHRRAWPATATRAVAFTTAAGAPATVLSLTS